MKFRFACVFLCALLACSIAYADTETGAGKPAASERSAADRQPNTIAGVLMQARGGPPSGGEFLAQVMGTDKGGAGSDCCVANGGLGCDDPTCEATVCAADSFCCTTAWDGVCAAAALSTCAVCDVPPADCANATNIPLSAGQTTSVSGTTVGSTFVPIDFCGTSVTTGGVWYTVAGTGNTITLTTCPEVAPGLGTADYDSKISVYCDGCGILTCVAGNDDGAGCAAFRSLVSFCSEPGEEYHILVHGFSSDTGTFTMQVSDNDTSCSGAVCGMAASGSDKAVTKTDNVTSAVPGQSLVYTIVASNNGPDDDPSVSVTDTFPSDLDCSWTSSPSGGATGNTNGSGDLNDTLNMPSGSSVTYTVTCDIDPAATGTLSNTADISTGTVLDPDTKNNSATDDDTTLDAKADLSVIKDAVNAPSDPQINDVFDYDLVVSNAGPSDATNVVVTDSLPSALGFVGSDCGIVEGPPGELTWNVGTLAAGASAVCTLTVEIGHFSDLIINVAETESDAADDRTEDNSDESVESGAKPIIPTLAPWGLLLLALGLAAVGVRRLRRNA